MSGGNGPDQRNVPSREQSPGTQTPTGQSQMSAQQNAARQRPQGSQTGRPPQPQLSQADLNRIVLEYLNKKGYTKTEAMLRLESTNTPTPAVPPVNPATANVASPIEISRGDKDFSERAIRNERELRDLREKQLRVERELRDSKEREFRLAKEKELRDLRGYEESREQENNPDTYFRVYSMLRNWANSSLDLYKPELSRLLYPIFVHCFFELVSKNFPAEAKAFLDKFREDHDILHGLEINSIAGISLPEHLNENELAQAYRSKKYRLLLSKTTINLLLYFLHENEAVGGAIIIRIINHYLNLTISSTRTDKVDLEGEVDANEGLPGVVGRNNEIEKFNEQDVKLGKMPLDPEVHKEVEAELKVKDEEGDPINGKTLTDEFQEMTAPEENSPARESLPLPRKDYSDLKRLILSVEDSRSKISLGAVQASAPSVCMYTFHNTNNDMSCIDFNDDAKLVGAGFQDSYIKLWSLDGKPLKSVLKRDRHNNDSLRKLIGHSGPVYSISFSPDNRYMISGSEDKTVRLWSLDTYTALVSYKGHNLPIWDVKFSPLGHYFATASHDQTARLWATDHIFPLRIFAGHINDVDCVEFHPNSNYIFTGSTDKTCRMWDVQTGHPVRVFMGHTGPVNCLAVSPDGRWLASAGEDCVINVWDLGSGRRLKSMRGHGKTSIYSLCFSRDGSVLVSGGADNTIRVWDVKKNTNTPGPQPEAFELDSDNLLPNGYSAGATGQSVAEKQNRREIVATADHMTSYFTKRTPVFKVKFTRRNLCLAGGAFMY